MSDMILTLVYCWIIFFLHTPHIWMRRYFFSIFSLHFFCLTILRVAKFIEGSITDKFLTVGLLMSSRHVLWSGRSFFGLFQFLAKSFFMGHRIVLSNHKIFSSFWALDKWSHSGQKSTVEKRLFSGNHKSWLGILITIASRNQNQKKIFMACFCYFMERIWSFSLFWNFLPSLL